MDAPNTEQPDRPEGDEWQEDAARGPAGGEDTALVVSVDGYEGPLDLLLTLARTQKVDLAGISVLALAEQYLAFIEEARKLRLELAADYLVMASWLAFLKSKLLLPEEETDDEEPTGEELARMLAFRLKRLEAMRQAAGELMARKRLGRDVFARGAPEGVRLKRRSRYTATVFDLLKAYAVQRQRTMEVKVTIAARVVWSIKEARQRLEALLGMRCDWAALDDYLAAFLPAPDQARTVRASAFGATLEMAREGLVELRQAAPFAPLYVRRKGAGAGDARAAFDKLT